MRVFIRVTEVISSNRSYAEQVADTWRGSGTLRISVAHQFKHCPFLKTTLRVAEHSRVIEIPPEWLEHEMFLDLGACVHCWKERLCRPPEDRGTDHDMRHKERQGTNLR